VSPAMKRECCNWLLVCSYLLLAAAHCSMHGKSTFFNELFLESEESAQDGDVVDVADSARQTRGPVSQ